MHVPDLPLSLDQATAVGFGLWKAPMVAMALECVLVLGAMAFAMRGRTARRPWILAGALCVLQVLSELVVPLPPDAVALGMSAFAVYFGAVGAAWWAGKEA